MQTWQKRKTIHARHTNALDEVCRPPTSRRTFAMLLFMGAMLATAQQTPQQTAGSKPAPESEPGSAASGQLAIPVPQNIPQKLDVADIERRKRLADDSARLLKLANDLKSEVDKTNKDTLSVSVIRKADEIEKLARSLKEKLKLTAVPNPGGTN